MRIEILTISSGDGTKLDGLRYSSTKTSARRTCVNFVHGKTMNFYVGLPRLLPPNLTEMGYDCLCLNRRGNGIGSIRDSFLPRGDAWTTYSQHLEDVNAGLDYLRDEGYERIVLVGHSLGGYLSATIAARRRVDALILASPIFHHSLSTLPPFAKPAELEEVRRTAKRLAEEGQGGRDVAVPAWPYLVNAATLIANTQADQDAPTLAQSLGEIRSPTLIFYGTDELDKALGAWTSEEKHQRPLEGKQLNVIDGADHFYNGRETQVTDLVRQWLAAHSPLMS